MINGEARVSVMDAEIFPVKIAPEEVLETSELTKTKAASLSTEASATAVRAKDFSDVFARLKKSGRKKSASIL